MLEKYGGFSRDTIEPDKLRVALGRFATGVTVVTTCSPDGKCEGLTVNSFSSVSLDPPLILWSLRRDAPSLSSFMTAGRFAINVLESQQHVLSQHFSRPALQKFDGIAHERGLGGCPILPDCVANFECRTETTIEGGDHIIFIGRIERLRHQDGHPLIFSAGKYLSVAALAEHV
jgi:flavin reductase (DIM6/NTAB) family NADH-FMN oxidoreductase RutF